MAASCSETRRSSALSSTTAGLDIEQLRREILLGGRGRRARSEQSPTGHLWGHGICRGPWSRKRTSAPQMGQHNQQQTIALVLRSRRSWPVAPRQER